MHYKKWLKVLSTKTFKRIISRKKENKMKKDL